MAAQGSFLVMVAVGGELLLIVHLQCGASVIRIDVYFKPEGIFRLKEENVRYDDDKHANWLQLMRSVSLLVLVSIHQFSRLRLYRSCRAWTRYSLYSGVL